MSATKDPAELNQAHHHIVITRRVRPGCEADFQKALREFFQESFGHNGVLGASMIVPPPGSGSSEFGILRTFVSDRERDHFYTSPLFKAWEERVAPLTEDGWTYRHLHGLEAWFRSPQSLPARWKMALLTWVAVWPVSVAVRALLLPLVSPVLPPLFFSGLVAAGIVTVLTWGAMPLVVKAARPWLQSPTYPSVGAEKQHRPHS